MGSAELVHKGQSAEGSWFRAHQARRRQIGECYTEAFAAHDELRPEHRHQRPFHSNIPHLYYRDKVWLSGGRLPHRSPRMPGSLSLPLHRAMDRRRRGRSRRSGSRRCDVVGTLTDGGRSPRSPPSSTAGRARPPSSNAAACGQPRPSKRADEPDPYGGEVSDASEVPDLWKVRRSR
jgi:hypothetical protein